MLRQTKREQLKREGVPGITEKLVDQQITKDELALHCRRRTRGERQTIIMIEQLLNELIGVKGRDYLGVPLLDHERMQNIWQTQKKHVKCIQDEPGFLLYTVTGTTTKEGIVLPNYRCASGSTSLESFHLHLNRFIPGQYESLFIYQHDYIFAVTYFISISSSSSSSNSSSSSIAIVIIIVIIIIIILETLTQSAKEPNATS